MIPETITHKEKTYRFASGSEFHYAFSLIKAESSSYVPPSEREYVITDIEGNFKTLVTSEQLKADSFAQYKVMKELDEIEFKKYASLESIPCKTCEGHGGLIALVKITPEVEKALANARLLAELGYKAVITRTYYCGC